MHIKTIMGAHIDCVGQLLGLPDEARELKDTAFAADDRVVAADLDNSIQNAPQMHSILHSLTDWAGDICNNGTTLSREEVSNEMFNYKSSLEALI